MLALAKSRPIRRDNFQSWQPAASQAPRATQRRQPRSQPLAQPTAPREQRAAHDMLLSDAQWQSIADLPEVGRPHRVGRRPTNDREVIEAILWVIHNRARWRDLPADYPSPRTCQRRLRRWQKKGVWTTIWHTYLTSLDAEAQEQWGRVFLEIGLEEGAVKDETLLQHDEHRIGRPPFWYAMAQEFWASRWAASRIEPAALIQRWTEAIDQGLDHDHADAEDSEPLNA